MAEPKKKGAAISDVVFDEGDRQKLMDGDRAQKLADEASGITDPVQAAAIRLERERAEAAAQAEAAAEAAARESQPAKDIRSQKYELEEKKNEIQLKKRGIKDKNSEEFKRLVKEQDDIQIQINNLNKPLSSKVGI